MNKDTIDSFREKLDQHYAWPSLYIFKFIVPKGQEAELRQHFPAHDISARTSSNGNYTSFTIQMMCPSSDFVIDVYQRVAGIEGLIAL